jgi:DNA-directed RNA polymerase specialized sigma24 family protein
LAASSSADGTSRSGAADCEALADATLDRVARRLSEGQEVAPGAFGAYVRGVARMIYYESLRAGQRQRESEIEWVAPAPAEEGEVRLELLERALETITPGDRDLVLEYYGDGVNQERRRRLAAELGMTPSALRVRAHRLRQRLLAAFVRYS